jgi:hypothetical protein
VSKSDFDDFGSSGLNPLDGDLLDAMGPAEPASLEVVGQPEGTLDSAGLESVGAVAAVQGQVEEKEVKADKGPGFLDRLAQSNPYTVMLVVSVVALLIGTLCFVLELSSYGFDTKAKSAGQSAAVRALANPAFFVTAPIDSRIC